MSEVTADGRTVTTEMESAMWQTVYDRCHDAKAVFFEGCHKIYLAMDDEQVRLFRDYNYEHEVRGTQVEMFEAVEHWYWEVSCGSRFVSAVSTVDGDPNDGFEQVVPQFFTTDEEGE